MKLHFRLYKAAALCYTRTRNKLKPKRSSNMRTKTNKTTKKNSRSAILGVALALVVLSIAYSTYVVWFGTTGMVPKIMLVPQAVLATVIVIWKFTKE